jgi:hypothetical protein
VSGLDHYRLLIQAVQHPLRIPSAVPFLATGKIDDAGALELDHHPQNPE